jgi:uncharacterized membrane protein YdjX (TVP38/TMEM64 family)
MKDKIKNIVKASVILCVSLFFIYLMLKYQNLFKQINIRALRRFVSSFGPMSFLVFLLIYSLKPILVVFPAVLLTALAGNIFGPTVGFLLSMVGVFFSATFAFYLSKSLGQPFVAKITRGKLLKLDNNIEVYGFKIIFLMRLSALFPIDPLSYASGLTKMNYRDFIWGTILGLSPEMMAYAYLGERMRHPFSLKILIPIFIIVVTAVCGAIIYKSFKLKKKNIA